jgi:hypothetical protein
MRPIVWGIILTVIGGFFWVTFSVIYGVGLGLGAPSNPVLQALVDIFGFLFFFSVPIAIVAEIVMWARRRRVRTLPSQVPAQAVTSGFRYCTNCGSQILAGSIFCDKCGARQ